MDPPSTRKQIYLRARQPAATTARQLAELLNAELDETQDGIYLRLPQRPRRRPARRST